MKEEGTPLNEYDVEDAHRVAYLIAGYINKALSKAERQELDAWVAADESHVALFEELTDEENRPRVLAWYEHLNTEQRLQRLKSRLYRKPQSRRLWSIAVAASILMVLGLGSYLFFIATKPASPVAVVKQTDKPTAAMLPGKVQLTLDNGKVVLLDSAADGQLAVISGTKVVKDGSSLTYNEGPASAATFHTLSTSAGGQYRLTLPDGTVVWLNALSTLRFPTAFTGEERRVELTGEAYFEVATSLRPASEREGGAKRPFIVRANGVEVEVLGTHFNVNAYGDEGVLKTTLLEGSVRVAHGGKDRLLAPGQQALVRGGDIEVAPADTDAAAGWKEGKFVFHQTPLTTALKELERWYGVVIENKEGVDKHLTATLSRSLPLNKVLRLLEGTGDVRFRTEGKKVMVVQ